MRSPIKSSLPIQMTNLISAGALQLVAGNHKLQGTGGFSKACDRDEPSSKAACARNDSEIRATRCPYAAMRNRLTAT